MRLFSFLTVIFCIWQVSACNFDRVLYADDRNYYLTVKAGDNPAAEEVKLFLEAEIPKNKYTITYGSGMHWPYFKVIALDEKTPLDSLIPPHTFIHRILPFSESRKINEGEFVVEIEVFFLKDTLPDYQVTVLKQYNGALNLSATTGRHFIDSTEFRSMDDLKQLIFNNCLRYSFK